MQLARFGETVLKNIIAMSEITLRPYTIRLFMPNDDPNTFKIIDKMNWTGLGLEVARDS
jgi:hypothetical protein